MNLSPTNKASFFILFLVTIIFLPLTAFSSKEKTTDWLDEPITLSFQNESLSNVLKQISEQTGISIAYDQKLANEKISGSYQNVKASDAITRLFKSKNKSIQVNKEKKFVIVKTFGAKNFIWANTPQGQNDSSKMTLAELEKMHTQQYKEYKERIDDDNEVLDGGMTRGKIKTMHQQQYKEIKKRIADNDKLLDGGMTRGEIKTIHEQQYKEFQKRINNDNVALDGNMTRGEIKTMHQQQYKTIQTSLKNNDKILDGNMTSGQIKALHKKQYEELLEESRDTSMLHQ